MSPEIDATADAAKVFDKFWGTSHLVIKDVDRYLKKTAGLSAGLYAVLKLLYLNGGTLIAMKLAQGTGTRPHNITALVKKLKAHGLVSTRRKAKDARFVYISLTEKSRALLESTLPAVRDYEARLMSPLESLELAQFHKCLTAIEESIKPKQ